MFKRIAVAVDGSGTSNQGLRTAIDLAADQGATLVVLHVVEDMLSAVAGEVDSYVSRNYTEEVQRNIREAGRKVIAKAEAAARNAELDTVVALIEPRGRTVSESIVAEAKKQKADVIVLGTHGRRGLRRMVMGSDAEAVVREAKVPVLLIREDGSRSSRRASAQPEKRASAANGSKNVSA